MATTPHEILAACPRCGKKYSSDLLDRLKIGCPDCVLSFMREDEGPSFPNLDVQEPLGAGGMGIVYRAYQPHLHRTVALKILAPKVSETPEFAERFNREAVAMARLTHPNIISIYEYGVHGGVPFLLMEYAPQGSLRTLLSQGPVEPVRARDIAVSLLEALELAHSQGIVHRDIKPENILFDGQGRVKLADFGLARLALPESTVPTSAQGRMGTPHYMAPEQTVSGSSATPASDLFAVGVVLYEMLTGKLPLGRFEAPSQASRASRSLEHAVLRLLEESPGRRYPSAADARKALQRCRPIASPRGLVGAAALLIVASIAGALYLKGSTPPPVRTPVKARPVEPVPPPEPTWAWIGPSPEQGGVSRTFGNSQHVALALDRSGRPVVAWHESVSGGANEIYLRRWTGTGWEELGGSATGGGVSQTPGGSFTPSLALDPDDRPVVAWHEAVGTNLEIYLKRWDGSAWVELGGSATGGGISATRTRSAEVDLALDRQGNPVVAWDEQILGRNSEIYLKRWDGSAWVELAGSASGGGVSRTPGVSQFASLRLDAQDRSIVVWHDVSSGNGEIYLKRWDGQAWTELDGSATLGGISRSPTPSYEPSLALDAEGNPIVAWNEFTDGRISEKYLRRWNGRSWVGVGGSDSGGGISRTPTDSFGTARPAMDAQGRLFVVWHETSGTPESSEVRLARWDGEAWTSRTLSVDPESARALAGTSRFPQVAVDRSGAAIVAWHTNARGNFEIVVGRLKP